MDEMIYTMANTRIFIGESAARSKIEVTPEDFQGVNWIEIKGLMTVGELGGEQAINEFELINSDWMLKSKGTRNGGTMANVFIPMALDPGQIKFQEAIEEKCRPYPFRIERGADCAPELEVAISVASPGVVTWTDHGFSAGQPVMFTSEGGTVPAGLTAGVIYYVLAAGLTDDTFTVSATPGGAAIVTTDAGTGTIIATAPPAGMTDMFLGLATDGARSGGDKNAQYTRTLNIAVTGRVITV